MAIATVLTFETILLHYSTGTSRNLTDLLECSQKQHMIYEDS